MTSQPDERFNQQGRDPREPAWSDAWPGHQLSAWAERGDTVALAEFAEALGYRCEQLWARADRLAARSQQLGLSLSDLDAPDSVALAGVRACIRSLVVETGDDVATVAATLDLDPEWARGVLTGEVRQVDPEQMRRMAEALEAGPEELFVVTDLGADAAAMLDMSASFVLAGAGPVTTPAVHHLVDAGSVVHPADLRRCVAGLERHQRLQLAHALDQRHRALCRWSAGLDRHEALLAKAQPEPGLYGELARGPEVRLSAAPAAAHIALLVAETGDDLGTVARGLGMDEAWVRGVVSGDVVWLDPNEAHQLCAALDLAPSEVFGAGPSALVRPSPTTPLTASPPDSDIVQRIKAIAGALEEEVGIEASERGLDGRERDDWAERRLDELTDLGTPLPEDHRPSVALAADYRRIVLSQVGVDVARMAIDGPRVGDPIEPPDPPGFDLGP